uniref:Sushi domain-containing protein 2 n=1 Tax=Acrobeloides nanus TaxID=290746 RepID=A0A914DWE2_9BILA
MIGPYWADIDTRTTGNIYYRESLVQSDLQKANQEVTNAFPNSKNIQLKWTYIVTWYNVTYYPDICATCERKRNTLQLIIATDGVQSFAIFYYNNITWTTGNASGGTNGLGGIPAKAGFDAGDGKSLYMIPGSCEAEIITIGSRSNVGSSGKWVFRVDNAEIQTAGCQQNFTGQLSIAPTFIELYGHEPVEITGPCFNETSIAACRFYDNIGNFTEVEAKININSSKISCLAPFMDGVGRRRLDLVVSDDGENATFTGNIYTIRPEDNYNKLLWTIDPLSNTTFNISFVWNASLLGPVEMVDFNIYQISATSTNWAKFGALASNISNNGTFFKIAQYSDFPDILKNLVNIAVEPVGSHTNFQDDTALGDAIYLTMLLGYAQINFLDAYLSNGARLAGYAACEAFTSFCSAPNDLLPCPPTRLQSSADPRFVDVQGDCACRIQASPSASGGSQECCYDENGNLVMGPNGGFAQKYHPVSSYFSNKLYDQLPYEACCQIQMPDLCSKFQQCRPQSDGSGYTPPQPAGGRGDPHIITFDGLDYTFNGKAEFWLVKNSTNIPLAAQARMEQYYDGTTPKLATIFTTFVFKDSNNNSPTIQVQKSVVRTVDIFVDGQNIDLTSPQLYQLVLDNAQIFVANDKSSVSITFNSGFNFIINTNPDAFTMFATCDEKYKGKGTAGLLGVFDGNSADDLTDPNGNVIPPNSSLSDIHYNFGLKWMISQEESLFSYGSKNYTAYNDPNFMPSFDEPDINNAPPDAYEICGDARDCLYDFLTTNNAALANQTLLAAEKFNQTSDIYKTKVVMCTMPSNISNGYATAQGLYPGDNVTFSCAFGYVLKGSDTLFCQEDGTWNNTIPTCSKLQILWLSQLLHLDIKESGL